MCFVDLANRITHAIGAEERLLHWWGEILKCKVHWFRRLCTRKCSFTWIIPCSKLRRKIWHLKNWPLSPAWGWWDKLKARWPREHGSAVKRFSRIPDWPLQTASHIICFLLLLLTYGHDLVGVSLCLLLSCTGSESTTCAGEEVWSQEDLHPPALFQLLPPLLQADPLLFCLWQNLSGWGLKV